MIQIAELISHSVNGTVDLKKIKRAQDGGRCTTQGCPGTKGKVGYGGIEGYYTTGPFSSSSSKSVRLTKQDERQGQMRMESREPYEGDFHRDKAPGGFGGGEGKKATRWRTSSKGETRWTGEGKMKKGGKVKKSVGKVPKGYHKMPGGKLMKNSAHKSKKK